MVINSHEIVDKIIETEILDEACKYINKKYWNVTNYAVSCEGKLIAFTGTDIIDADNLCYFLQEKFPEKQFDITDEFLSFED